MHHGRNDALHSCRYLIVISHRCGHCKKLAPIYEEAAAVLAADNIPLASVNCVEETSLYYKHDIQGYPTIKAFLLGYTCIYISFI